MSQNKSHIYKVSILHTYTTFPSKVYIVFIYENPYSNRAMPRTYSIYYMPISSSLAFYTLNKVAIPPSNNKKIAFFKIYKWGRFSVPSIIIGNVDIPEYV